jgi:uncharacterized protein YbaP (TraB family)
MTWKNARTMLCLTLAALLCTATAPAQATDAAAGPRALLWKVGSDSGTVYLFGSIHFGDQAMYPLPQKVDAAFDASRTLVVEVNAGPDQQPKLMEQMMLKGLYPPGETMDRHVPAELLGQVRAFLTDAGMPPLAFDRFKPWLAALTVAVIEIQKLGLDPELGIDHHFLDRAARASKPILELETFEEQMDLFDSWPDDMQRLMLEKTMIEVPKMQEQMKGLVEAWKQGDTARLESLIFESLLDTPELKPVFDKLFTERNTTMARKIEAYLAANASHFVVVGAGHLIGDTGIVEQLKRKGFAVQRL